MGSGPSKSSKRVVIVGAGDAGKKLAVQLDGKVDLTLVEPNAYVAHHIAALRAAVQGAEYARTIVAPVPTIVPNGRVVMGSISDLRDHDITVTRPDGSSETIPFDYAVICTGSSYNAPGKVSMRQPKAVVEYYGELSAVLARSKKVLVVGGGPVGMELAGEIASHRGDRVQVTLAHRGPKLFSGIWNGTSAGQVADGPAEYAKTRLEALGVKVLLGTRVVAPADSPAATASDAKQGTEGGAAVPTASSADNALGKGVTLPASKKVSTTNGAQLDADIVFWCTGATPNTQWMRASHSNLLDERGFIKVDAHLRVQGKTNIFCMGDCAGSGDQKLTSSAWDQVDKIVLPNLQALIAADDAGRGTHTVQLKRLQVSKPTAIVAFGPDSAMADLGGFALCDCLVVRIKARDLFRKEFKNQTHGTAADSTDWAAKGIPGWDLAPPAAAGQAK